MSSIDPDAFDATLVYIDDQDVDKADVRALFAAISQQFGNADAEVDASPYVVKYDTGGSAWPARPSTSRPVHWISTVAGVGDPAGAVAGDLLFIPDAV